MMHTKQCTKCHQHKEVVLFGKRSKAKDGLRSDCRTCRSVLEKPYKIEYRSKNKEKISDYRGKYHLKNRDKEIAWAKRYRALKQTEIRNYNRKYFKDRASKDLIFRLKLNIRKRINKEIKKHRWNKNNSLSHYLGCSLEELRKHLESLFQPGMSWDNHGLYGWHIDHKIPLSKAKNEKELYALSHFSNLQPLWALQNLLKGDKF